MTLLDGQGDAKLDAGHTSITRSKITDILLGRQINNQFIVPFECLTF